MISWQLPCLALFENVAITTWPSQRRRPFCSCTGTLCVLRCVAADDNRAVGVMEDIVADTPEYRTRDAPESTRSHDDHFRQLHCGLSHDRFSWFRGELCHYSARNLQIDSQLGAWSLKRLPALIVLILSWAYTWRVRIYILHRQCLLTFFSHGTLSKKHALNGILQPKCMEFILKWCTVYYYYAR